MRECAAGLAGMMMVAQAAEADIHRIALGATADPNGDHGDRDATTVDSLRAEERARPAGRGWPSGVPLRSGALIQAGSRQALDGVETAPH